MSRYGIDPAGISAVLKTTAKTAEGFAANLQPLPGYVTSAGSACGNSGAIVPALDEFFAEQGRQIDAIELRVDACLTGAAAATKAYGEGDLEMMLTYQRNASRSVISEIPR